MIEGIPDGGKVLENLPKKETDQEMENAREGRRTRSPQNGAMLDARRKSVPLHLLCPK